MFLSCVLLLAAGTEGLTRTDRVCIWELNHFLSEDGKAEILVQVVLWRWEKHGEDKTERLYVVDWEHAHKCGPVWKSNGHWYGRFKGVLVRAEEFEESWSNYDVECVDRLRLDNTKRTGVRGQKRDKGR